MNPQQILDLQRQFNAQGAGLKEDGKWGPKTQAAFNKYSLNPAIANNPKTAPYMQTNTPDAIHTAYLNNDWSGVTDQYGTPFSPEDQRAAYEKGNAGLEPYYKALKQYETGNVQSDLEKQRLDYQNYLATSAADFQKEKTGLDQQAADQGVLFSGGRVQKQNDLKTAYDTEGAYKKNLMGLAVGDTARKYQYAYGNDAANNLSSYYNLGGNTYNPGVARGGVGSGGLSSIYNPGQYNFGGTRNAEQSAEAQGRAAGLLWNRGNKLLSTGYKNKY